MMDKQTAVLLLGSKTEFLSRIAVSGMHDLAGPSSSSKTKTKSKVKKTTKAAEAIYREGEREKLT